MSKLLWTLAIARRWRISLQIELQIHRGCHAPYQATFEHPV